MKLVREIPTKGVMTMLKYYDGYVYEGHTFVINKSDISNATDDQFVTGTALIPYDIARERHTSEKQATKEAVHDRQL